MDVDVDHIMANQVLLDNILAPHSPAPPPVSSSGPSGSPQTDLILCAGDEDQFAGDPVFEACTSGSPPEESPPKSASRPNVKMSCNDIRDLTPEQKLASEQASADKAKQQQEQRAKQIARAREEMQFIATQEA